VERIVTRRRLLRSAALLSLASLAGPALEGCRDSDALCADPELLSRGEEHMRRTLEYIERAPAGTQQCSGCQFFSARGEGDCGHCEILNGAVSRQGRCSSWAARG
jgi:hypothetical protein